MRLSSKSRDKGAAHKFDGNLVTVRQMRTLKENPKRSFSNLFAYLVVGADDIRGRRG